MWEFTEHIKTKTTEAVFPSYFRLPDRSLAARNEASFLAMMELFWSKQHPQQS